MRITSFVIFCFTLHKYHSVKVRGRYMFRVDDVVRPGGCSNKTGGTCMTNLLKLFVFVPSILDPIMIYPNIVVCHSLEIEN